MSKPRNRRTGFLLCFDPFPALATALTIVLAAILATSAPAGSPIDCNSNGVDDTLDVLPRIPTAPDNGQGTVDIPAVGVAYRSTVALEISDGLPQGTVILADAILTVTANEAANKGEPPSAERRFEGQLYLAMSGTGSLVGLHRELTLPLTMDSGGNVAIAEPRVLGPVQSFDNELYSFEAKLEEDSDFGFIRVTAGSNFNLPSPGHTTLSAATKLAPGSFEVDSYFIFQYSIEFQGAEGGALDGLSGNTNGFTRIQTVRAPVSLDCNANGIPDECELDSDSDGVIDACDNCELFNPGQDDCNGNGIGDQCDLAAGTSLDCNSNGNPDECDVAPEVPAIEGNEEGTVETPALFLPYVSREPLKLASGLTPGGSIDIDVIMRATSSFEVPDKGGSPGSIETVFTGELELWMTGRGSLAGFTRIMTVPLSPYAGDNLATSEAHVPGDPVQSFDTLLLDLRAVLQGDPDFALLEITAGDYNDLPSPGHTTLTLLPSGKFAVDSYFDMVFSIYYEGEPGGALGNSEGYTVGTARLSTVRLPLSEDCNANVVPDECEPDSDSDGVINACDNCQFSNPGQEDCNNNGIGDLCELVPKGNSGADCQPDGIPDECQLVQTGVQDSGDLPSFDGNNPDGVTFIVDARRHAVSPVGLEFTATAGMQYNDQFAYLLVNGQLRETILGFYWPECLPKSETVFIPAEEWNALAAANGGYVELDVVPTLGVDVDCDSTIRVVATIEYDNDCNANGVPDDCDIAGPTSEDCDGNGIPDECQPDCDGDGMIDACEAQMDCNRNNVPDDCDIADGTSLDCNANGVPDECDDDCNGNGVPDECDIAEGTSQDCDEDGVPDECGADCNGNGIADSCDIGSASSLDCNGDGIPDECQLQLAFALDSGKLKPFDGMVLDGVEFTAPVPFAPEDVLLRFEAKADLGDSGQEALLWLNGRFESTILAGSGDGCAVHKDSLTVPASTWNEARAAGGGSITFKMVPSLHVGSCSSSSIRVAVDMSRSNDCNANGFPDDCDIASGSSDDCDGNGVPDDCEPDCNANGIVDACDISNATSDDCDGNGVPDDCEPDCNANGIVDACDVYGASACPSLDNAPAGLAAGAPGISALIPNRFNFAMDGSGGDTSTSIGDGGGDMYDTGNILNTDLSASIQYTDGVVTSSDAIFGTESRYFTKKHDGFFVLAAKDITISSFSITGNNGADGNGYVNAYSVVFAARGGTYTAFVKQVGEAGDPSINQIIVVPGDGDGILHNYSENSDNTYQEISGAGVQNLNCLVYILASRSAGALIADDDVLAVSREVLKFLSAGGGISQDTNFDGVPDECAFFDCNGNGNDDTFDIASGFSQDCNGNGIPDECDVDGGPPVGEENGGGTASIPTVGTAYVSQQPFQITEGLPEGSTIEVDVVMNVATNAPSLVPTVLGGEMRGFMGTLDLTMRGTGGLAGFNRALNLEILDGRVDTAPRTIADNVQDFDSDIDILQANFAGDSDFTQLLVTAGNALGLASPGHTTLTRRPSGGYQVFGSFDVAYEIAFAGAPGSVLEGLSGTTAGSSFVSIRFTAPASIDCDMDGIPDECEPDCNANGIVDGCDILNATSIDCDGNGVPDECEPDCNGNGIVDACDVLSLGTCPPLPGAAIGLEAKADDVTALIPDPYDFDMDGSGGDLSYTIGDGGQDMFDGGNILNTNLSTQIPYTDGIVQASDAAFGPGSSYFTKKYDSFFVMAATNISIGSFYTEGNNGADGQGTETTATLSFDLRGNPYTAYFKGIGGAADPTINQIIVVAGTGANVVHDFPADTDSGYQEISGSGVTELDCLVYILAATDGNLALTEGTAVAVAKQVVDGLAHSGGTSQDTNGSLIPDECEGCPTGTTGTVIAGTAFADTNGNGRQDDVAPAIEGVAVLLFDAAENMVADTTTAADGSYQFKVQEGTYFVVPIPPSDSFISPKDLGPLDDGDCDIDPATGRSDAVAIGACTAPDVKVDIGLYGRGTGSMLVIR